MINSYEVAFRVDNELKARFKSDRLDCIYNPYKQHYELWVNNDLRVQSNPLAFEKVTVNESVKALLDDCIEYYNYFKRMEKCKRPLAEYLKMIESLSLKEQNDALKDWEELNR